MWIPDLRAEENRVQDLQSAVEGVARPLREAGVEVIVGIAVNRPLAGDAALLVHRAVREILLDVRRRSGVTLVTIGLTDRGADVALTIDHNSIAAVQSRARGGDHEDGAGRPSRLDSLTETLAAHRGALVIDSRPGLGTRYTATLPAA